jgi:hypothetical protein
MGLTAKEETHALARYIEFFRQQHKEARRAFFYFPALGLKSLQLHQHTTIG